MSVSAHSRGDAAATPSAGVLAGRSVLVVDDCPDVASLIVDVLRGCGADCATAHSGREAMTAIQLGDPDLLVLDLAMPSPNGWDVLDFIRVVRPALLERTLLLTGGRRPSRAPGFAGRGLPIVKKPFRIEALRAAACRILERSATRG